MQLKTLQAKDLEVFNSMPFCAWIKDEEGHYLWANEAMNQFAGQNCVGKSDQELRWAEHHGPIMKNDQEVLSTEQTHFIHEMVPTQEGHLKEASVCKFVTDYNGQKCSFGIGFYVD